MAYKEEFTSINFKMKKHIGIIFISILLTVSFFNDIVYSQSALDVLKKKQEKALTKEKWEKEHQDLMEVRITEITDLFKGYIIELSRQGIEFKPVSDKHISYLYPSRPTETVITKVTEEKLNRKLVVVLSYIKMMGVELANTFLMFHPVGVGPISIRYKFYKDETFTIILEKHGTGIGHSAADIELFKGNDFTKKNAVIGYKNRIKKDLNIILAGDDLEKAREKEREKTRSRKAKKIRRQYYNEGLKLFNSGRYAEAIAKYDLAIDQNSNIIGELSDPSGKVLSGAKRKAERKIEAKVSKSATEKRKRYYLDGLKLIKTGDYTGALQKFDLAIDLNDKIIGEPSNPTNDKLRKAKELATDKYEEGQKKKGLLKYEGKWITPKEKAEIEVERKKQWKQDNPVDLDKRTSLGVNYPGISIRIWQNNISYEFRAQSEEGVSAIGGRICKCLSRTHSFVSFMGVEADLINFTSELTSGSGVVIYGLLGGESFISKGTSFGLDFGPAYIMMQDSDYSMSNFQLVINLAINFYVK